MPELVPIRYGRMLGLAVHVLPGRGADHGGRPGGDPASGVTVQLCGDAHLSNFGLFGSPERQMLFDINDFDETLPGPVGVGRQAAGGQLRDHGPRPRLLRRRPARDRHGRRSASTGSRMRRGRRDGDPRRLVRPPRGRACCSSWSARRSRGKRLGKQRGRGAAEDDVAKARTRDSTRVFAKRADEVDGELRIVADPPLIVPIEDLVRAGIGVGGPDAADQEAAQLLPAHARRDQHHPLEEFRYVHAARKVVGVGSVGTRCYILLLVGRDDDDPLFLQVKEAQASVLERVPRHERLPAPRRSASSPASG